MLPSLINNIKKQQSMDSGGSTSKSVSALYIPWFSPADLEQVLKQASADSNSLRSLEIDDVVDREFGNREEVDREKTVEELKELLESCKTKPVAFAVRTNVEYKPAREDQCPLPDHAIAFTIKEFIHVKDKFNADWWIGRRVAIDAPLGFVPSALKLEKLKSQSESKSKSGPFQLTRPKSGDMQTNFETPSEDPEQSKQTSESRINLKEKRKIFFKRAVTLHPPYDVVPNMRPVVLVGPSLKGYDVTDMMQKAVFDFLKKRYEGSITMTRVSADISLVKRSGTGVAAVSSSGKSALSLMERGAASSRQGADNIREIYEEIERIFELARSLNLVVLDCDTINHPAQLQKTSLAPIIVYLKISSPKVLQKLIKSRGKSQAKNLNVQLVIAEKLAQCPPSVFDVILDHNQLEDACAALADYLDNYWEATHPKLNEPAEKVIVPHPPDPAASTANLVNMPSMPSDMMLARLMMTAPKEMSSAAAPSPTSVTLVRPQWRMPAVNNNNKFAVPLPNPMVLPISPAEPQSVRLFTLPPIAQNSHRIRRPFAIE